jgi:hypothetical protein
MLAMPERADRFFTWVWRINGLVLLALGLAGVVGATALAFNMALFWSRDRPDQQLTQVAGADLNTEDLRLADFRPIAGTQFLYAALAPPSEYIGSGSSGGLGLARNLLFFDMNSRKAHWLFPDNDQVVKSFSFLMDPPGSRYFYEDGDAHKREQVAVAILLELEPVPNKPGGHDDARSLAIATAEGRGLASIAQPIGGLLGYHQASKDSAFVFYVSDGAARVLDLDPTARKVRSDALLSAQE